jgi:hypothetical protein
MNDSQLLRIIRKSINDTFRPKKSQMSSKARPSMIVNLLKNTSNRHHGQGSLDERSQCENYFDRRNGSLWPDRYAPLRTDFSRPDRRVFAAAIKPPATIFQQI